MLKAGDAAPDFAAQDQDGDEVTLSEYRGKTVVLYFYPRDNTPGCTTEACEFRDAHSGFERLDAVVLGVSSDSVKSHAKFRDKFDLPFRLISDEDKRIHEAYGTWVEKKMYGKTSFGTQRSTYIIDGEGVIKHVFPKVKAKGHAEEVAELLQSL